MATHRVCADWGSNGVFPGGSEDKESAYSARDPGSIPGLGRFPGEGNGYPLKYSCMENPMDRGLAGDSPWGHEELDMTEQLNTYAHLNLL